MTAYAASALSDSSITETERSDLRIKLAEIERTVAKLQFDIDSLKRKLALREDQIDILLAALGTRPLSRADPKFDEKLEGIVNKYREKGGSGGEGKRNCLATGNRVLTIEMEDGFATSTRSWRDTDDDRVRVVPAIKELSEAGRLQFEQFLKLADAILAWSNLPQNDCRFSVGVRDKTTRKDTYKPQLIHIERRFRRHLTE